MLRQLDVKESRQRSYEGGGDEDSGGGMDWSLERERERERGRFRRHSETFFKPCSEVDVKVTVLPFHMEYVF